MTDKPAKAELTSMDIADDKRRQLAQLFPEAVTETRTDDGKLVHAVDYERLKGVLGEFSEILENQRERYGMTWPGKNECLKIIQQPSIATLKPCREESVNFDETENLFIEGDNLEALKLLQKAYYGKVKMIYIDPPYNTGKEFIYPDNYSENLDTYLSYTGQVDAEGRKFSTNTEAEGRFHSKWLNMMLPRLYLARNLLREDGVLLISIDDGEFTSLRAVCDDLFGEECFLAAFIWNQRTTGGHDAKDVNVVHEYILCFGKNRDMRGKFLKALDSGTEYPHIDGKTNKSYKWDSLWTVSHGYTENCDYPIPAPDGSEIWPWMCHKDQGKVKGIARWFWNKDTYSRDKEELLVKRSGSCWKVYKKVYGGSGTPTQTILPRDEVGGTSAGKAAFQELFPPPDIFENPKSPQLVRQFLSRCDSDAIILDFFSGSCTTAHAVLEMNKQDGGNRKFIMVQLPEPCDEKSEAYKAGYKTIADIGKERIRRVIAKFDGGCLKDEVKENKQATLFSESNQPSTLKNQTSLGFKVFKLARSNFRLWDGSQPGDDPDLPASGDAQAEKIAKQLELHEQHIDPNATQEDILYELLLKAGFPLTTKVEKAKMAGKEIFSIAEGALLICLQDEITKELIKAMADADPLQVICLDSGFKNNDQLKANAVQTFKARNKGTESATVFRTV